MSALILLAELLGVERVQGGAEQGEVVAQKPVAREVVEGGHEQALGQIARSAENQHHARVARRILDLDIGFRASGHLGRFEHW